MTKIIEAKIDTDRKSLYIATEDDRGTEKSVDIAISGDEVVVELDQTDRYGDYDYMLMSIPLQGLLDALTST